MLRGTIFGSFATSLIGPLLIGLILYNNIPDYYLFIWISLHFILFFTRVFFTKKLLLDSKSDKQSLRRKLIYSLVLSALISALYGVIIWIAVLLEVSELNLLLITMGIVALSAGSISTLGSIFHAFILFVGLMIIPLIGALLYHGGEIFGIVSFIISVFILVHISAGYRHYITIRNAISLKESFETIFNQTSDGIVLVKEIRFKDCNDSVITMFGYNSKEKFLGTHLKNFSPKYQPDGTLSSRKMILMLRKAWQERRNSFEWLHVKANGNLFWTEIVLTRIHLDGEDLIHGVWRDISKRKEAEFQLESLNTTLEKRVKAEIEKNRLSDQKLLQHSRLAQMGEMISMIAHQWRQPLSAISSTSLNLKLKLELEIFKLDSKEGVDECSDYFLKRLEDVEEYVQSLTHTIDDFRNFYKPNKKSVTISLEEIINRSLHIIQASLKNDNIEIQKVYHAKEPMKIFDSELMQVILNLLKNAQDNFKEKQIKNPYIKITTQEQFISICDNGGGIPKAILEKIFDPYFSTKDEKNGTGLGLYMSKIIVEDHHKGRLHVSNTNDGVCFTIQLGEENSNEH